MELDTTKIETKLNYKPEYDLERTIKETVTWYKQETPEIRKFVTN